MCRLERSDKRIDVLVTAVAPFLLTCPGIADEFSLFLPVFNSEQQIYRSIDREGRPGLIYVCEGNSPQVYFEKIKAGDHCLSTELSRCEQRLVSEREIMQYSRELDSKSSIAIWEPLGEMLATYWNLQPVNNSVDPVPLYLSVHESWLARDRRRFCESFAALF